MKSFLCVLFSCSIFVCFSQDWESDLNQARKLYNQGKYNEALKYYKSAEKFAPKDVDLSEEIAQASYHTSDYKEAANRYSQEVSKSKSKEEQQRVRMNLGESQIKQQNYQDAIETYKNVLREDQHNEKARQRLMEAQKMYKKQQQQNQQQNQQQQQNNQNQQQNQQNQQNQNQTQKKQQLENKEIERKLDELSKQEMNAKKRVDGQKGSNNGKKASKDW